MLIDREVWKPVVGYEGLYEVSSFGNVRSVDRIVSHATKGAKRCPSTVLSQDVNHAGYHRVSLYRSGTKIRYAVHRLVAEAFLPNPDNLPQINHKDESPHNNCVSNIEWCNNQYNMNYGTRTERASARLRKPVIQLDANGSCLRRFISASEAGRFIGKNGGDISGVCLGKRNFCGGFRWKYE